MNIVDEAFSETILSLGVPKKDMATSKAELVVQLKVTAFLPAVIVPNEHATVLARTEHRSAVAYVDKVAIEAAIKAWTSFIHHITVQDAVVIDKGGYFDSVVDKIGSFGRSVSGVDKTDFFARAAAVKPALIEAWASFIHHNTVQDAAAIHEGGYFVSGVDKIDFFNLVGVYKTYFFVRVAAVKTAITEAWAKTRAHEAPFKGSVTNPNYQAVSETADLGKFPPEVVVGKHVLETKITIEVWWERGIHHEIWWERGIDHGAAVRISLASRRAFEDPTRGPVSEPNTEVDDHLLAQQAPRGSEFAVVGLIAFVDDKGHRVALDPGIDIARLPIETFIASVLANEWHGETEAVGVSCAQQYAHAASFPLSTGFCAVV